MFSLLDINKALGNRLEMALCAKMSRFRAKIVYALGLGVM